MITINHKMHRINRNTLIIIIFLIFQKYFTKGIAMGAVKG